MSEERRPAPGPEPLPEPGPEPGPASGPERGPEPIEAAYHVTPAAIEQAVERTGQKYVTDMAALYDRVSTELSQVYQGQLAAKDQALAAKDETIAELRRRAEAAEAELSRRQEEAARREQVGSDNAVFGHDDPASVDETSASLWARLGRWWRS